jgi:hypothetical protein
MKQILLFILLGLGPGALIAGIALGVVLTYRGAGVVNLATGGIAMALRLCLLGATDRPAGRADVDRAGPRGRPGVRGPGRPGGGADRVPAAAHRFAAGQARLVARSPADRSGGGRAGLRDHPAERAGGPAPDPRLAAGRGDPRRPLHPHGDRDRPGRRAGRPVSLVAFRSGHPRRLGEPGGGDAGRAVAQPAVAGQHADRLADRRRPGDPRGLDHRARLRDAAPSDRARPGRGAAGALHLVRGGLRGRHRPRHRRLADPVSVRSVVVSHLSGHRRSGRPGAGRLRDHRGRDVPARRAPAQPRRPDRATPSAGAAPTQPGAHRGGGRPRLRDRPGGAPLRLPRGPDQHADRDGDGALARRPHGLRGADLGGAVNAGRCGGLRHLPSGGQLRGRPSGGSTATCPARCSAGWCWWSPSCSA